MYVCVHLNIYVSIYLHKCIECECVDSGEEEGKEEVKEGESERMFSKISRVQTH